jgi:molybdopterin-guanine dinucleotide biosynthesis protein MobB
VLAVSGDQASGKTTLLVATVRELRRRGLSVALVKRDAHGIELDVAGKDSDRLFRAGAEVTLDGAEERFQRFHPELREPVEQLLRRLERRHDLVLVEGYRTVSLPRVWLLGEGGGDPPPGLPGLVAVLGRQDRDERFLSLVVEHLRSAWESAPVRVRLGSGAAPSDELERALAEIPSRCAGAWRSPLDGPTVATADALPAAPGVGGPLGLLLGAMRWDPDAAWLALLAGVPPDFSACLAWLLAQRRPGCWAVLPRVGNRVRPSFALYEPQAAEALEAMAASGDRTPASLARHPAALVAEPPRELHSCWKEAEAGD